MLPHVPVDDTRTLDDYREDAGEEAVESLRAAAEPLRGARVVNISSTAFGGGVAELLPTQIAIMRDLGIEAEWHLIEGTDEFFAVTKSIHNALQGAEVEWTRAMEATYLERVTETADVFDLEADVVLVHDPQPVALLGLLEDRGERRGRWVWRCHIDLSRPREDVWGFLVPYATRYDADVFTLEEYVHDVPERRVEIIPPSIDPHALKNGPLPEETIEATLAAYGVDLDRPVVTQVSRFDPWKDPLGVMEAFRAAREEAPGAQLVLVGSMAHDDPEGWEFLERTEELRAEDPDIHVLTNLQGVGALEVNAFQRGSDIVVQKSLREGFGLTASEAMWKERPVIAGAVGGLRLQVEDGTTGYLVDSVDACAARLVDLLGDEGLRDRMGKAGRERVRQRFLSLREVEDHLRLFASLT